MHLASCNAIFFSLLLTGSASHYISEVEVRIYKGDSFGLFGSLRKRRLSVETFILQVVKVQLG